MLGKIAKLFKSGTKIGVFQNMLLNSGVEDNIFIWINFHDFNQEWISTINYILSVCCNVELTFNFKFVPRRYEFWQSNTNITSFISYNSIQ